MMPKATCLSAFRFWSAEAARETPPWMRWIGGRRGFLIFGFLPRWWGCLLFFGWRVSETEERVTEETDEES